MTTYGGTPLFSSGPCDLTPGAWPRQVQRRGLAGTDGELLLDGGRRSRTLVQTGRLQAPTAQELRALVDAVEAAADATPRTLVGPLGNSYDNCVLETIEITDGPRTGRGIWCDYRITYRQLP